MSSRLSRNGYMRMQAQDNTEVLQRGVPTTSQRIEELKQYIYWEDVVGLIANACKTSLVIPHRGINL